VTAKPVQIAKATAQRKRQNLNEEVLSFVQNGVADGILVRVSPSPDASLFWKGFGSEAWNPSPANGAGLAEIKVVNFFTFNTKAR
jgi:hypothetical protein